MNWENYKTLTPKQKDEFNFRFKEPITYPNFFSPILIMISLIIIFTFTIYLIISHPELELHKEVIIDIYQSVYILIFITSFWAFAISLEYIANSMIRTYTYSKWKKENNIVELHWWSRWLK